MMRGRRAQAGEVGEARGQDFVGRGQRAIDGSLCGWKRVAVDGREGIDAIVARLFGDHFGAAIRAADREGIGVDRFIFCQFCANRLDKEDKVTVVNVGDDLFRKSSWVALRK